MLAFREMLKFPLLWVCSFHLFLFCYWRYQKPRTKINIQYRNMIYRLNLTSGQSHAACHSKPSSINICARLKWIRSENVTKNSITNNHSFFRCWLPLNNTAPAPLYMVGMASLECTNWINRVSNFLFFFFLKCDTLWCQLTEFQFHCGELIFH